MFEGLVRQLILGYLGQYIKDIQKDQLKITLWNEEVLLENVELILEAFDYLRLPFAFKKGQVGKLSIRIPWKKLGWDPIIIVLEDIYICVCQRDDEEWCQDAAEKRDFASKKARLAAAELAKLSRRVCDNQTGKSFTSHITAKILDSIQVSIRNFHFLYRDTLTETDNIRFGLRFSSLTVTKRSPLGSSTTKVRGGQVNKLIEVQDLELYCNTFEKGDDICTATSMGSENKSSERLETDKYSSMLAPLNVVVSLSVNRSGNLLNDDPQYTINVELSHLDMSIDEVQLQKILLLGDYMSLCHLREKYGRYRPWWSPLPEKHEGWQIAWWKYAQESVLSDVRRRLKKTSWKYLGDRLNARRKYVNLYKTKLKCLRHDQVIEEHVQLELEEMDKETDIDDILDYRSLAERELEDFLVNPTSSRGNNGGNVGTPGEEEYSSSKPRGWLNWLSYGMLGAGGTNDSVQFSGVISDEVIKDIYEATKFHPAAAVVRDSSMMDEVYLSSMRINIFEIRITLRSMELGHAIADLALKRILIDGNVREKSTVITASVNSAQMLNPSNSQVVLLLNEDKFEDDVEKQRPAVDIEVNLSTTSGDVRSSVKVVLDPVQVFCDSQFVRNILDFLQVLKGTGFQQQRILLSLNGFDDLSTRVLSKIDYVLSSHKKTVWDINLFNTAITIPLENTNYGMHKVVVEAAAVSFTSNVEMDCIDYHKRNLSHVQKRNIHLMSLPEDFLLGSQFEELYDKSEIQMTDVQMKILIGSSNTVPLIEKFNASMSLVSCILSDEPVLKALEVCVQVPSFSAHFSTSVYGIVLGLITQYNLLLSSPQSPVLLDLKSNELEKTSVLPWMSIGVHFDAINLVVNLEDDIADDGCIIKLYWQKLDVRYDQKDFLESWVSVMACRMTAGSVRDELEKHVVVFSAGTVHDSGTERQNDMGDSLLGQDKHVVDGSSFADRCLLLHYEGRINTEWFLHEYMAVANNLEIHCYPHLVGKFNGFMDRMSGNVTSDFKDKMSDWEDGNVSSVSDIPNFSSYDSESILSGHFLFSLFDNLRSLCEVESTVDEVRHKLRKSLDFREQSSGQQNVSLMERTKIPSDTSVNHNTAIGSRGGGFSSDAHLSSLKLGSINLHFHDSSCILGTIMLPSAQLIICNSADFLYLICLTEGAVLSSSWWREIVSEILWGPSPLDLSPILNIHVRRRNTGPSESRLELRFDIRHVSCMLPPEFLSVMIGYFSLPDWSSFTMQQPNTNLSSEVSCRIVYNIEIADCDITTPANSDCSEFLKLNIGTLRIVIAEDSEGGSISEEIPSECCVGASKFADRNLCLDFCGRDLSLLFVVLENGSISHSTTYKSISLIAPLTADVWVRIPCDDISDLCPMCIMAMVDVCQLDIDEGYAISGCMALGYAIDLFTRVGGDSKLFTSDIPHFRLSIKDAALLSETSVVTFTEVRFCVRSLSLRFNQCGSDSTYSEYMAVAKIQFLCSLSLMDEVPQCFDISVSSLALFSFLNSVVLAECACPGQGSSALDLIYSVSDHGEQQFVLSLPSLDVWLHLTDWIKVIDLLNSCSDQLSRALISGASTDALFCDPADTREYVAVDGPNNVGSANMTQRACSSLTLEHVGLAIHFPALFGGDIHKSFGKPHPHDRDSLDENCSKLNYTQQCFFSISLQITNSEVVIDGKTMKFTLSFENLTGVLKLYDGGGSQTWPIFQLSKVNLDAGIFMYLAKNMHLKIEVLCDSVDFSLSDHTLYLFQFTWFEKSEENPSQISFNRMDFKVQLRKISLLLTDWKTSSGPLLEFLVRDLFLLSLVTEDDIDASVDCDLQVKYYNIDKVLWEPFLEPWKFQLSMNRKHDDRALFSGTIITDIRLKSMSHLNVNLNESIIEVISRVIDMISDALLLMEKSESQGLSNSQMANHLDEKHAPYMLQNLTTLPLSFCVWQRGLKSDNLDVVPSNGVLQPGSSTSIYINESPEELFRYRPVQSSDRLNDMQLLEATHRYVTFGLEGTSAPSTPISMDLVGRRYFEVEFSKSSHVSEVYTDNIKRNAEGDSGAVAVKGFAIPVVVDVSVQSFTKLMRLYSTVLILNTTSIPLEVRFDIPFGVSPKILGPIYPSQEFPLPLHLAEAGCVRWRPCGDSYLWSEAYNISNIISQDVRIGFLRSFVCYPSHPSNEAFRCCISVSEQHLPPVGRLMRVNSGIDIDRAEGSLGVHAHNLDRPKNRSLYQVMLTSPLMFKNYLMRSISLTLEYAGVARAAFLSEVETSVFHIDSSQDLSVKFQMHGFRPSILRFPRAESFSTKAKFSGTKFCMSEVIRFDPEVSDGPLYVTIEKVMDAFSGAREISISVPFLLYNCSGFSLILSNSSDEVKGYSCIIPSCYDLDEKNGLVEKKRGLSFICADHDVPATGITSNTPDIMERDSREVRASLFSPDPNSHSGEIMARLSRYMPSVTENVPKCSWSAPFSLVPPTGSTSVLVSQPSMKSAYVISVTAVAAPFSGKTKIITFEPRYVIANACSKNVCYKQKGTDLPFLLGSGQHSYIQWTDTTRELLLSVRFDEPGWEWSGGFLPEHLGDTQVKVRNYMTTAVNMVRVEVRSADVYVSEGKIVGSTSGNSGTNLIVLFEDDACFMPYRIDNHSRERLRVYQPKCESFETLIYPYTSSPYAWDEPCFPHRLIIEVPGERILGSYNIDDASVHSIVHMRATPEKPERNFDISVRSEGAIKVLSIIDSSYHVLSDMKGGHVPQLKDKRKQHQKYESIVDFKEILFIDIPFLGISLMSSHPEELLFACAKNTEVSFVQSLDHQKFSLQILSFQIDNQLHSTPYPVLMSFHHGNKGHMLNQMKPKEYNTKILMGATTQVAPANSSEPVFSIAFSKWRDKDTSLISFESISVRIADFYLDIEQEIVLRLFEFCKTVSLRMQKRVFQQTDSTQHTLFPDLNFVGEISGNALSFARLDEEQPNSITTALPNDGSKRSCLIPHILPIGAPWQQIQIPSKKNKKIFIELLDMAPIKLTLSFSSSPWMLRQGVLTSGESLIHRGLMALADVEGAKIHFKELVLSHQIASVESVQDILVSHYSRQFLHEMYKVFGSAGVIGNPMGFARSLGLGIKDFLSLPVWNVFQSPAGLFTGMAQGTSSLLSNTVYAISDATSQFSKAAHKGIVAFTFDDGSVTLAQEQKGTTSQSKGVINEFLEGLTGVLQSPIKGAEKHGLPGVLSGIAVGVTGLIARPAASILEVTGKTAQSIRNRSRIHQMGHRYFRVRLPRPLSTELPLKTYSWEEAIGIYVLSETDLKLMDETLVTCKALKQSGQYALLTGRLILVVSCSSLVDLGGPQFEGVPPDLKWDIQSEIALDSVILADNEKEVVHIVGSSLDTSFQQKQQQQKTAIGSKGRKPWNNVHTPLPLFLTNLELKSQEEADEFLRVLLCIIEKGKEQGWGSVYILHQSNTK